MSLKAATSEREKLGLHHQPFTSRPHQVKLPQDRVQGASPASANHAKKSEHTPSRPRQFSDLLSRSQNSRMENTVMPSKAGKTSWPRTELGSVVLSPFWFLWHTAPALSCPGHRSKSFLSQETCTASPEKKAAKPQTGRGSGQNKPTASTHTCPAPGNSGQRSKPAPWAARKRFPDRR